MARLACDIGSLAFGDVLLMAASCIAVAVPGTG